MIESVNTLEEVLEPYAGQIVHNDSDGKVYRWDPIAGWELFSFNDGKITMNAYEINQQIIGQLPSLTEEQLEEKKKIIRNFCGETKNKYYMLLCRDINYYTLFHLDLKLADEPIEEAAMECAENIGQIKSIELTEDGGAIEFWMTYNDETYVAYFFPYDQGVIICG